MDASNIRKLPAVATLTVQPDAAPRFVGWLDKVADELEKPVGVVQVPDAVVQMSTANDLIAVLEGTVKESV